MTKLARFHPLLAIALGASVLTGGCGDSERAELSGGDVLVDSGFKAVDFTLTSDNFNKWRAAQDALDSANVDPKVRLNVQRLTEDDIDAVVKTLENDPRAKQAIETADISVRDYVLTTIALAQSWDAANRPTTRLVGVRPENVEFVRLRAADDPVVRERPRARFIDEDDDSDDDSDDSDRKRKKNKRGKDSDSDS